MKNKLIIIFSMKKISNVSNVVLLILLAVTILFKKQLPSSIRENWGYIIIVVLIIMLSSTIAERIIRKRKNEKNH